MRHEVAAGGFAVLLPTKVPKRKNSIFLKLEKMRRYNEKCEIFVPIILSFLSDEKRKNNVYPNKKEKKTALDRVS